MFDFSRVQFEQNYRIDLLTGAQIQTYFYRNLAKMMKTRKRSGGALFIVTIKALPSKKSLKPGSIAARKQITDYENLLKSTSNLININLRSQDFYTRMAVDGFYILISGEKLEERKLSERFKKLFADRSLFDVKHFKLEGDVNPADWLAIIDRSYFNP
jgi:GGDEF domain-containing protein